MNRSDLPCRFQLRRPHTSFYMDYFIPLIAFFASLLTFFSGFGLGTIMVPVFLLFFPVDLAIALAGIVHLLTNLFKISLVRQFIDKEVLVRFGSGALIAAYFGAELLKRLSGSARSVHYEFAGYVGETSTLNLLIAALLFTFAMIELLPFIKSFSVSKDKLIVGGILSGFSGGLSGHQGALRTIFLVKAGMSTEAFIATGISIALIVDLTRIPIYFSGMEGATILDNAWLLSSATGAAFLGALIGRRFLKKVKIASLQTLVGILILIVSILLGMGILGH